jgi:hypothetical protein
VPISLTKLRSYVIENKIADAPEVIVQIRNAIVHSKEERRKMLNIIPNAAKYEGLQLCILYIELALLNILGYTGDYFNRCSGARFSGDGSQKVPWI